MKNFCLCVLLLAIAPTLYAKQYEIANGDIAALKAAIIESNSNNSPDTIHLAFLGIYKFTTADNNFVNSGDNALPVIQKDGNDTNALTIFGNGATLTRDPSISILRLLYLVDCKVTIYDVNLMGGTTFEFDGKGGAIFLNSARLTIHNSLLKDNTASEAGAVCMVSSNASFTAKNCTFSNNKATFGTGSVMTSLYGGSYFENCTIVDNVCVNSNVPAAIYNFVALNANTSNDNVYLKNTIVARNIFVNATSPDNGKEFNIGGAVYTQGGNLIGAYPVVMQIFHPTFRQGSPNATNDYVGTETSPIDPALDVLGANGYFTQSYTPKTGSKALLNNAGTKRTTTPQLTSNGIVPHTAYPGDVITVTGMNMSGITKVQFTGTPNHNVTSTATNAFTITVPANAQTGKLLIMDAVPNFLFSMLPLKIKSVTTPDAPINLLGISESSSSVKLTWNDVATDEDNYRIEYKIATDNNYTVLETIGANATSYIAENLACETSYNFRVVALGRGTESVPSNITTVSSLSVEAPTIAPPSSTTGCIGNVITLTAPDGFPEYTWSNNATTKSIDASTSGSYTVRVKDASGCTSDPSSAVTLTFIETPSTPSAIEGNATPSAGHQDVLYEIESQSDVTYEWSYSGTGATLTQDGASVTVDYSSTATTGTLSVAAHNGCGTSPASSLVISINVVSVEESVSKLIKVSPNPTTGKFSIEVPRTTRKNYAFKITDGSGRVVYRGAGKGIVPVDLSNVTRGIYVIVMDVDGKSVSKKIVLK